MTGWTSETFVITSNVLQSIKFYNVQTLPASAPATAAPTQLQSTIALPPARSPSRGSVSGLALPSGRPDYNRVLNPQWTKGPEYYIILFRNDVKCIFIVCVLQTESKID
jgi:hypothetical protein